MKLKQRVLTSVLHDVKAFDHFHFSFVMFSLISSVNSLQAPRVTVCLCICGFRAQFLQSKGYFSDRKQTKSVSFPFIFFYLKDQSEMSVLFIVLKAVHG